MMVNATQARTADPVFSAVIPFYNEEDNVGPLLRELAEVLDGMGRPYEIVCVDDGSKDGTRGVIDCFAGSSGTARLVAMESNRGQGAALLRGLTEARGQFIVTMDGDRQNSPQDIPKLWKEMERSGADMVVGIREGRKDGHLRHAMSRLANGVRRRFLKDSVSDAGCALKLFRREVVASLIPLKTLYSFIPALAVGGGFSVAENGVTHLARTSGGSSYGLRAFLWRPLVDMLGVRWYNARRSDQLLRLGEARVDSAAHALEGAAATIHAK